MRFGSDDNRASVPRLEGDALKANMALFNLVRVPFPAGNPGRHRGTAERCVMNRTVLLAALLVIAFTGACTTMHTPGQTRNNEDLATRIAALEDRAAIKQLVDRFSVLADVKKTQEQTALFTEDAAVSTTMNGQVVSSLRGVPCQFRHRLPRQRPTRSHPQRRHCLRSLLLPGHAHRSRERQANEDVDARDLQRLVRATGRDVVDRGSQIDVRDPGTRGGQVTGLADAVKSSRSSRVAVRGRTGPPAPPRRGFPRRRGRR